MFSVVRKCPKHTYCLLGASSPEEAFAAFTGQGIEVVTLGQVTTHTAGSGLVVFCQLPILVLDIFTLLREHFSDGLKSIELLVHSHLREDYMILASFTSH